MDGGCPPSRGRGVGRRSAWHMNTDCITRVWWSNTNRGHVDFESLLDREYLLAADATVDVVAIAAQPLALLWPHGTSGQRNHVPDFFVRLASGDGRLVDVRAPNRVSKNAVQFAMTR